MIARRKVETVAGTAAELAAANTVFPIGWPIFETDTNVYKFGNGTTGYNTLPDRSVEKIFTQAERDTLIALASANTGDETSQTILNKIGDGTQISSIYLPSPGTTDDVVEGATNKYWTNARSIASTLTGYVKAATASAIVVGDTIIGAIAKLEKALDGKANINTTTGKIDEANLPDYELMDRVDTEQFTSIGSDPDTSLLTLEWSAMDSLLRKGYAAYLPVFGATNPSTLNIGNPTTSGTASRSLDLSSWWGQQARHAFVTTAVAANRAILRIPASFFAFSLGFAVKGRFTMADANAGKTFFQAMLGTTIDLGASTALGSAGSPLIGIGIDAADSTLHIFHHDGSTGTAKIPLGANYPMNTSLTDVYEWYFWVKAGIRTLNYTVVRKSASTGAVVNQVTGSISTNLPADTQLLGFHTFISNNALTTIMTAEVGQYSFQRFNP